MMMALSLSLCVGLVSPQMYAIELGWLLYNMSAKAAVHIRLLTSASDAVVETVLIYGS